MLASESSGPPLVRASAGGGPGGIAPVYSAGQGPSRLSTGVIVHRRAGVRWRILPLMMVFVALAHFNRVSMSVTGTEQIIPAGLLSETEMGVVYSAYLLPYTLFMIPGGWFIDRFGPRLAWVVAGLGAAGVRPLNGGGRGPGGPAPAVAERGGVDGGWRQRGGPLC